MHCALRSVRCRPCVRKQGFKVCHWPLLRVDAPVWAKVHAASAKSGGCGIDESRPQGGGNKVRRTALLMLGLMAAVLVLASGVALAKDFVGTEAPIEPLENLSGLPSSRRSTGAGVVVALRPFLSPSFTHSRRR